MTTASGLPSFPGPLASKRRRMRSGGTASTAGGVGVGVGMYNAAAQNGGGGIPEDIGGDDPSPEENVSEQKTTQTSKCKGATTIPIFLKKTYKMIDTCDPSIASWTEEGDMFVVKDPDLFSKQVIPQYFDHNKFSSFARQLNFYGFRKMQSKPIRNSDFDAGTAKHVTFYNENFKKGRCDLLKKIQRSTRGGVTIAPGDQSQQVQLLRDQVQNLEQQVADMALQVEERVRRLELDMLARMEQMMLAVQQQQRTQLQLEKATSVGSAMNGSVNSSSQQSALSQQQLQQAQQQQQQMAQQQQQQQQQTNNAWDNANNPYFNRASSVSSAINSVANAMGNQQLPYHLQQTGGSSMPAPTLPPHPKQKQGMLPLSVPGDMGAPPDRMNSLRGISTLSRGVSGLARGASVESSASAVLMRNSWEDKFFSMLMLDNNNGNNGINNNESSLSEANLSPTPLAENGGPQQGQQQQQQQGPATVSNGSANSHLNGTALALQALAMHQQQQNGNGPLKLQLDNSMGDMPENDDLSDVSSGDLP